MMENVRVDADGNLRCWNCGGKQFLPKRTGRAHIIGYVTVGIGALATNKKLKCHQCGKYNKSGQARPYLESRAAPARDMTPATLITTPSPGSRFPPGVLTCFGHVLEHTMGAFVTLQNRATKGWLTPTGEWSPTPHHHVAHLPGVTGYRRQWSFTTPQLASGRYELAIHVDDPEQPAADRSLFQIVEESTPDVRAEAERPSIVTPETGTTALGEAHAHESASMHMDEFFFHPEDDRA